MRRPFLLLAAASAFLTSGLLPGDPAFADTVGPAGPVISFFGHRYSISRGMQAFESLAFDPVQRRVASNGKIFDLCANQVSAGPDQDPGLAWDPRTGMYWDITPDRTVRRWNAGTLVDTAFVIPLTFSVPGTGPDTLESVRGIALDSNYVYLVDAGPAPGALSSNEWLKFTRSGVPVLSSKSTDFVAHLDLDPDALVDDIVYVPFGSPVAPGKLLIALEHSGIQVIDTRGRFASKMRWSTQSLPPSVKLAAFAGITIDPLTGNLYLADNDQGAAQVWTRLPDAGPASYVVGTGSSQAYIQYPSPGCDLPLWRALPPVAGGAPTLVFGIAYRSVDADVYGCDYATGDLWKFDPRSGRATRVGSTGVNSIWGLAYDPGRDRLYGSQDVSGGERIYEINPSSAAATARPSMTAYTFNDMAFNPADSRLYGVNQTTSNNGRLIAINRDTGVGSIGANTRWVRGLDFDPVSGKFVGSGYSTALYHIDPSTGAADSFAARPFPDNGWEGLAVVTVPAPTLTDAGEGGGASRPGRMTAFPNPARAGTAVRFVLASGSRVTGSVYDAAGSRVRRQELGWLPGGAHSWSWDGRGLGGARVPSGLYFIQIEFAGGERTCKVALLR